MLKAYQYRLHPTTSQVEKIAQHFGCARSVYNWVLDCRKSHYEATGKTLSKRELQDQLVHEQKREKPWLKEVNSQALLAALLHATDAYQRFFRGQAKFPRFKSRKEPWQSYHCPQHVKVDFEKGCIQLPIIGWVKTKLHRTFDGKIKTCVVKRSPHGHYQISVLVEDGKAFPERKTIQAERTLGVDLGLKNFAVMSDGSKINNPRFLEKTLPRLKQLGRSLSRKKKGSKNREKSRLILARKHYGVARQREHFLHQATNTLLREKQAETIALEALYVKGMLQNKKLARHISNVAWSGFVKKIEYKAAWSGCNVIYCHRFAPSSKQCICGYRNKDLKLSDREWTCHQCKRHHDRDILAGMNIKEFALADAAGLAVCVKQFPHDDTEKLKCHGERSGIKPDGSQETPIRVYSAQAL